MQKLETICQDVHAIQTEVRPGLGLVLPLRTTLLGLEGGGLAIISPIAVDDETAAAIEKLGPVEHLIAPNRLHHMHVWSASERWPKATVHIARGLDEKLPSLRFDHHLGDALPSELEPIAIEGAPALSETCILHRPSRTLVVTDLVFNVLEPRGIMTSFILWMAGAHRRLAQSRALRLMTSDRAAAAASVHHLLALDFTRLVMAHGQIVDDDPKPKLEAALTWMLAGARPALPGPGRTRRASPMIDA